MLLTAEPSLQPLQSQLLRVVPKQKHSCGSGRWGTSVRDNVFLSLAHFKEEEREVEWVGRWGKLGWVGGGEEYDPNMLYENF